MKHLTIILLTLIMSSIVFAQESATMPSGTGNKSFFAELGGPGIYSLPILTQGLQKAI